MTKQNVLLYIGIVILIMIIIFKYKEKFSIVTFKSTDDPVRFHSRTPEQYNNNYYNGYILPNIKDNISAQKKFLQGIRDYDINSTLIYTNELNK